MDEKYWKFGARFINLLTGIIKAVRMYDFNNDTVKQLLNQFKDFVNDSLFEFDKNIVFAINSEDSFINGQLIVLPYQDYKVSRTLAKFLENIEVREITISDALEDLEISSFFSKMFEAIENETFFEWESSAIVVKKINVIAVSEADISAEGFDYRDYVLKLYGSALTTVRENITAFEKGEKFNLLQLKKIFQSVIDNLEKMESFLIAILHQTNFRSYLFVHLLNTSLWAIIFGKKLNLSKTHLLTVAFSAFFHDIGKVNLSDAVLFKTDELVPEEEELLKTIPFHSLDLILPHFSTTKNDLITFLTIYDSLMHYEESTDELMLFPRIVSICDAYDSLTSWKPYRDAYLPQEALRVLLKDDKFDHQLVKLFIKMVTFYPVGTAVELTNGDLAIVYSTFTDPKKLFTPKVIPILNSNFEFYDRKMIVDLSDPFQKRVKKIVQAVDPFVYGLNPMFSFFDVQSEEELT